MSASHIYSELLLMCEAEDLALASHWFCIRSMNCDRFTPSTLFWNGLHQNPEEI
jgi:hypothetical protein